MSDERGGDALPTEGVLPIEPTTWVPVGGGVRLATYVGRRSGGPEAGKERLDTGDGGSGGGAHAGGVGRGAPLLMINGLGASAHDWGPLLEILAAERRIIAFDNRGAGRSEVPDEPMTLPRLASDALAVMDAHGLDSADVLGYSMGGMIAQLVALEQPARVRRLVLLGTHAGARSAVRSTPEARAVMSPDENLPREELARRQYEAFVAPDFPAEDPRAFEEMLSVRLSHLAPLYAWRRQLQAVVESERADRLSRIRTPTLIVHGAEDPLIPVDNGRMLADLIPAARLVIVPGCGHMLGWEAPGAVAEAVMPFLSGA